MTLEQAMAIIATAQQALVANGFPVGTWGPCKDGIDGRWGPDTRHGWGAAISAYGLEPSQTTALLATLGVSEFDGQTLQNAINVWNNWRAKQTVGSVAYEVAATKAFTNATGISAETCGGATPTPEPSMDAVPDVYHAQPMAQEAGIPWWLWLVLGLVVAGAVGGGIWYLTKYKKGRRKKKKKGLNGYKKIEAGTEVTDEDFSGDVDDDEVT